MSDANGLSEIEHSEEEVLLRESAAAWLAEHADFAAVRRTMQSESGFDRELYRELARLGWLGIAVPAAYGGAGMRAGAVCSVAEPMGQRLFASPFLASTLAAQALLAAGSEAQRERWLPAIVSGEAIASVALSEPSGAYEARDCAAQARVAGGRLELSGTKTCVLDAQHADVVLAAVRMGEHPALLVLEARDLAGRLRSEQLVDETRRSARLTLDGLQVGRDALLGGGDAGEALRSVERLGWLMLAAEMAGGCEGVMQLTLEYLRTRTQFGRLIGSYQALKHPMVEIMCALEQGRSLLYHAATAFERADPGPEIALRMAKAQLGETFAHAADRAIQFHGAIGFTYECHAQLFFRRAQWAQYTFGDPLHHRRRLAALLLE